MKYLLLLFTIFCCLLVNGQQNGVDTIHWRTDYKLKAEDFKGVPEIMSQAAAVTVASTKYDSHYANDTSLVFNTYCVFDKASSWINVNHLDSNLLEHEQGHFDIAEVFRRKLEIALNSLESCNYKKEKKYVDKRAHEIFLEVVKEREKFDKAYDKACTSPVNKREQKVWTARIQSLLNE